MVKIDPSLKTHNIAFITGIKPILIQIILINSLINFERRIALRAEKYFEELITSNCAYDPRSYAVEK
jgi:hypothetical protein